MCVTKVCVEITGSLPFAVPQELAVSPGTEFYTGENIGVKCLCPFPGLFSSPASPLHSQNL